MKNLPEHYTIKREENNPLWDKYIDWINDKVGWKYFDGTAKYYGHVGSLCSAGFDYHNDNEFSTITPELITLEYWAECVEEKKIIGYRLVKPEYARAVCAIEGYRGMGESIRNGNLIEMYPAHGSYNLVDAFEKLKLAGVLDLWFEPVYEEKSETVEIANQTFLLKQNKVFLQGEDITEKLKTLLNAITNSEA